MTPALATQLGLLGSPPDPVGRFTMREGPSKPIVGDARPPRVRRPMSAIAERPHAGPPAPARRDARPDGPASAPPSGGSIQPRHEPTWRSQGRRRPERRRGPESPGNQTVAAWGYRGLIRLKRPAGVEVTIKPDSSNCALQHTAIPASWGGIGATGGDSGTGSLNGRDWPLGLDVGRSGCCPVE